MIVTLVIHMLLLDDTGNTVENTKLTGTLRVHIKVLAAYTPTQGGACVRTTHCKFNDTCISLTYLYYWYFMCPVSLSLSLSLSLWLLYIKNILLCKF